jgi:hypothetical protein
MDSIPSNLYNFIKKNQQTFVSAGQNPVIIEAIHKVFELTCNRSVLVNDSVDERIYYDYTYE